MTDFSPQVMIAKRRWEVEAAAQDVLGKWLVLDRTETTK
jgi:hypothetical protein